MSKLLGVKRFGEGWEQVADHPENDAIQVIRKAPAKSNVWIKTADDNGPLRAPPEARKFDPSELGPPRRAVSRAPMPPPKKQTAKPTVKAKAKVEKGRDPERHRQYMRDYMKKRRQKTQRLTAES